MPVVRTMSIAALCACALALPAFAAWHQEPPPYGAIVLSVEEHFALADQNGSDSITAPEYMAVSRALKHQLPEEARKDFSAMDSNNDGHLSFDEFYGELPSHLTI